MSLAEELYADLDDDADELDLDLKKEEDDVIDEVTEELPNTKFYETIRDVAKLTGSTNYIELVAKLQRYMDMAEIPSFTTPIETDPQYILVVKFSELASEIDQEINVIHKFVRDKYEKRFPELESQVQAPLDYINTVRLLGNDIDTKGQNKELLSGILPPAICIVVSMTASTSQGKPLETEELEVVSEACRMTEELSIQRMRMHQFVELRMALIAPNVCRIVGAGTAAMLVSQAGGLGPLSKQPACNVQILGKQKKTLSGFSSSTIEPHAGYIFYHPVVQNLPKELRQKATRLIAAKCTLAARIDSLHCRPDGSVGEKLSEEIKQKLDKLLEPPPAKGAKSLPKPLDKSSKKRGGKRVRRQKERMGLTELRKKQNRMNFGEIQEDIIQGNVGFSLGQAASSSGGGRIRAAAIDNKTRVKMSQKLQKTIERTRQHGGLTSIKSKIMTAGSASTVAFTPVQGIEISNQQQQDLKAGYKSAYFSSTLFKH